MALQLYDFCNDVSTVIGAVRSGDGDSNPLLENQDSLVLTIEGKRCRFASPADCNATPCPEGSYCDATCVARSPQTCQTDSECPAGSTCVGEVVIGATAIEDFDDDGVPNDQDNCPSTPNTNQNDLDGDLVGDACDLQTCQNAILETVEECDDGNFVGNDACTDLCRFNVCGDGFVYPGFEECDHGSVSTNNECLPGCILNTCGDGVVHVGVEPCDDGNASDSDACITGCVVNLCGDGHLNIGVEQCDDGAGNDDGAIDACRTNCVPASCGDGVIDSIDDCDDGNLVAGDGCDAACLREHPEPYQPLPDSTEPFTYTESRADVTTACPIVGVSVVLDIDHSSVGDLTLDLSYGATTVRLLDRPGIAVPDPATGGYDGNLAGVYTFADGGSAFPQSGGVRVHPSTYAPEGLRRTGGGGTLSDFNGLTSGGEWTLNLVDAGGTGSGALFRWQVIAEISCETTFTFSQSSGSPIGPDAGTFTTSTLNVPDSILIQRLGVRVDLSHSSLGQLTIDVTHGATTGRLVNQQGGYDNGWWANDDFGGSYLFRDNAGPFVWDLDGDVTVPPGLYSAEGSLRGFVGADAAGSWTLTIHDRSWDDGGTLNAWSILVTGTGPQAVEIAAGPNVSCGDGKLASNETCDDGNDDDGDGCTRRCLPSSSEMAKCQGALGKMNALYLTTRLKRLEACRNDLNQGKLLFADEAGTSPVAAPEDCGSEFDTVAAMAKLAGKIRAKVIKACGSTLLPQLSACASTVDGLVAADGLSGCLVVENNGAADDMIDDAYGRVLTSAEESENACQEKIASASRKYAAARLKALGKCRDQLAKGKPPFLDAAKTTLVTNPAQCELAIATEESMSKAGQKLRSSIADPGKCSDALVASLASACATTIDGLVNAAGDSGCLISGIEAGTGRNIAAAYDFQDIDRDGWSDLADNCPLVANPSQADGDGDGVPDACDNCGMVANAGQANADGDGAGDDCDEDADGDGVANAYDNCPTTANADQTDTPTVLAIMVDGSSVDVIEEPSVQFRPRFSNGEGPLRFDDVILACGACATSPLTDVNMGQIGGGLPLCGRSTQLLKYLAESGQPMCARSILSGRSYDLVFKSFKGSQASCFGPGCAVAGDKTSYLRSDGIGDACAL